jgi:hypothetical protein
MKTRISYVFVSFFENTRTLSENCFWPIQSKRKKVWDVTKLPDGLVTSSPTESKIFQAVDAG